MNVQMVHLLAALDTGVAHHAEPTLRIGVAAQFSGQAWRQHHHSAHEASVLWRQLRHRRNMQLGHHEKVHRRPRIDVMESENLLVLVDFLRGDFASNDFAEDAVGIVSAHGWTIFILAVLGWRSCSPCL